MGGGRVGRCSLFRGRQGLKHPLQPSNKIIRKCPAAPPNLGWAGLDTPTATHPTPSPGVPTATPPHLGWAGLDTPTATHPTPSPALDWTHPWQHPLTWASWIGHTHGYTSSALTWAGHTRDSTPSPPPSPGMDWHPHGYTPSPSPGVPTATPPPP